MTLDEFVATSSEQRLEPRYVFLFSGHMIDKPGREGGPRFPPDKEDIAATAIANQLDRLEAGPQDLGICGGACGGDLLFAEAALERGLELQLRIPFDVKTFLEKSVSFAGASWEERFHKVKEHPRTSLHIMPDELGPLPEGADPYERNNLWMLQSALAFGPEKVRFICLWDGKAGDGAGGTKHMYDSVRESGGKVHPLYTTELW